ncbi:unnamed protein product [Bursaphelenchus okinawaensis]|uniref:Uncharacterized protein n=1 Tax=Bursaphelenchus okinawaensis TaxID=465554 RepID=A0A811L3D8_9BILA|nr:unnamed protein product [Bursaphelenchus okinawaensis]CAG9118319.1 unnamed protein product [Bursaphelenchus okinawaensis]
MNLGCTEAPFDALLKKCGILRRQVPVAELKKWDKQCVRYCFKYKAVCIKLRDRLPQRKDGNTKQKKIRGLLNMLLAIPEDAYLTPYNFYAALGFLYFKEQFEPLPAVQFYSLYEIRLEKGPVLALSDRPGPISV